GAGDLRVVLEAGGGERLDDRVRVVDEVAERGHAHVDAGQVLGAALGVLDLRPPAGDAELQRALGRAADERAAAGAGAGLDDARARVGEVLRAQLGGDDRLGVLLRAGARRDDLHRAGLKRVGERVERGARVAVAEDRAVGAGALVVVARRELDGRDAGDG